MIPRYTRAAMARIWEDANRFEIWRRIEVLAAEGWNRLGVIPDADMDQIRDKAACDIARVDEIERTVKHDVIAFLTSVSEHVGPSARWIHLGLTSSDVLDTALAVQMKQAGALILEGIDALLDALREQAYRHKDTLMIGRTHGVHAEPTTFGLKMAGHWDEIRRARERFELAVEGAAVGKISGAVGTYLHLDPTIEVRVCDGLGLRPAPYSSQIVGRDVHAAYMTTLALLASSLERLALEIRLLARTEVTEAQEAFSAGQKGSSAMPHKKNPITAEQICGLARLVRGNAHAAMENIPLWHERDISHSSVERVILPDTTILVDYVLAKTTAMVRNLAVFPENMKRNLESTGGSIHSESVLLALVKSGLAREAAYAIVQRNAHGALERGVALRDALAADPEVTCRVPPAVLDGLFDPRKALGKVDIIFERIFGAA
jgi:adenylosuccinate lyase